MAKWNKKLGLVLVNFGLLTMAPNFANADGCYDPCSEPCSMNGFDVSVDFLYWKPCGDVPDYAVVRYADVDNEKSPDTITSKWAYKCLCLDWQPGFRIRAGKDDVWCNWRLDGSYTWLSVDNCSKGDCHSEDVEYMSSPLFHPSLDDDGYGPAFDELTGVKGQYKTNYQTWDVLLSYDIACNRCHTFKPFFGVEGLVLNQEISALGFLNKDVRDADLIGTRWNSDFNGVGLKVGTFYEFQMLDCLKFFGKASGSILVGSHDGKFVGTSVDGSGNRHKVVFYDGDCTQVVPSCNLAIGVVYETELCGTDVRVKCAWEFTEYGNISNPRTFSNGNVGEEYFSASPDYNDQGFQGLVVGAEFAF